MRDIECSESRHAPDHKLWPELRRVRRTGPRSSDEVGRWPEGDGQYVVVTLRKNYGDPDSDTVVEDYYVVARYQQNEGIGRPVAWMMFPKSIYGKRFMAKD